MFSTDAARSSTARSTWSGAATRLTSPWVIASSAEMNAPVTSISKARLRERLRDRATPGVMQNSPTPMPEVAKRASLEATARSQVATNWQPAAVARPSTRAMTGCGSAVRLNITRLHCLNSVS